MAIRDIPEYVRVAAGDLIRAEDWNTLQRQTRHGLRTHQHTRVATTPIEDTATTDEAQQIGTSEIADEAITEAKLASGAISTAKIANNAVTGAQIASNSVGTAHIQNNAITVAKLAFQTVNSGSTPIGPGGTVESAVQLAAPSTKTTVYFPTLAIVGSSGNGISDVDAAIVYRQAVGANTIDVYIRLTNRGAATASVVWQVLTFAS